ncbi:MAG: heat shock protein Hsp70 family [Myxococcales bacterium]|nr:heat shock protein Hsp70 family [Myxococcales bacterium]
MAACGLDFGTSNSTVALPSGEALPIDPTAPSPRLFRSVLFFPEEVKTILAGNAAIEEYLERSDGRFIQSVKGWLPSASFTATQIRNKAYKLEDLVALLLRRIREQAERAAGTTLDEVTLGRPAVFSPDPEADARAETRLLRAAELAGFRSVRFLIEPIAAALAYEATLTRDELVLVADFGAGTSDLTLMRLGPGRGGARDRRADVVASGGVDIGGDRFDAEIMRHKLLRHFGAGSSYHTFDKRMPIPNHILGKLLSWHEMSFIRERATQKLIDHMLHASDNVPAIEALFDLVEENLGYRLFRAIEAAKIRLSTDDATTVDFDEARVQIHEPLTRREFETFAAPLLEGLESCTSELLTRAKVAPDAIDSVFLTGGSSQIPSVRRLFADRFGERRLRTADAFTSVAEGLGRSAGAAS